VLLGNYVVNLKRQRIEFYKHAAVVATIASEAANLGQQALFSFAFS
jgi:hypothetical protein